MRLDHLLSTENTGCRSASGADPPRAMVACGRVAGVEEIMGFWFVRRGMFRGGGADALLGSRIATPGFCLARFDARRAWGPAVCRRDGVAVRGGLRTG